jgi:N-acetylneuraminic acid mutarotase
LICLLRTGRENAIYQCESDDEGATWTKAHPVRWHYSRFGRVRDLVGVDPDVIEMSGGVLAMTFGHKPDYEDHGNFICFSTDHGETWGEVVRLSSSVTQAYTGVREVAPGELFAVYTTSDRVQSPGYRDATFTTVGRSIFVRRPYAVTKSKIQWSQKASMLRPQAGAAAALLGGELVLAGGTTWENNVKLYIQDVQIYSPVSGAWRKGPPLPEGLAHGAFAQTPDTLEVFGGATGTAPSRKVWRLDADKAKWTHEDDAPSDFVLGRAASAGGSTFVFGGGPDLVELHRASNEVWKRDARGQWSRVSTLPTGAVTLSAIAVAASRVYLFGGCRMPEPGKLFNLADAHEYNPANNEWRKLRSLPTAVRAASAIATGNGAILIFGGHGETFSPEVWAYDVAADTYSRQEPMPVGMGLIEFVRFGSTLVGAGGEDKAKSRSARTLAARL